MQRLIIALSLTLAVSSVAHAAKDVCVTSNAGGAYIFKKVKKIKPGGAVPLIGLWVNSSDSVVVPFSGTAVGNSDGSAQLGIQVYSMAPIAPSSVNFTLVIAGADPKTFAGSGSFENEDDDAGDGMPDGPATFTSVGCDTITLP